MSRKIANLPFSHGFIIHKTPFEEHKLLLSIFDNTHGFIKVIARRPSKKKTHCFEPFTLLALQVRTNNNLGSLQQAETIPQQYAPPLFGQHLWAGLYCNELLYRICQAHELYPKTFQQYQLTIQELGQKKTIRPLIRQFEYVFLQELGFGIDFSCLDEEDKWFAYCPDNGLTAQPEKNAFNHPRDSVERLANNQFDSPETLDLIKNIFQLTLRKILGKSALHITQMLA